ncbi:MAG: HEPN domain-containing protein [Bacteroidia bacterium]
MANKSIHIQYWKEGAEESWQSAETLIAGGRYMMALFCWHLCIEKLLKAHWVKDNEGDYPPRIHNLTILHDHSKLNLTEEMQADFRVINFWNIEGRYPDYRNLIFKTATKDYIESKQKMIENIRLCLIEKLQ